MKIVLVLVVVAVLVLFVVVAYNRLVKYRNRIEGAWAQIDVQLQRRYDLIPNLVETVKGYAAHERETFEGGVALDRLDEIRDQVVAALELLSLIHI